MAWPLNHGRFTSALKARYGALLYLKEDLSEAERLEAEAREVERAMRRLEEAKREVSAIEVELVALDAKKARRF